MGCGSSISYDPNEMYGKKERIPFENVKTEEETAKEKKDNDQKSKKDEENKGNSSNLEKNRDKKSILKGDLSLRNEAKINRRKSRDLRLRNCENRAKMLVDQYYEESERFSVSNSRATSRVERVEDISIQSNS
ncbi:DgyrCDS9114 [Dimorphilus gyrociliatus]|uniref:DgyrCDS9114 n=1 Tax=Dimorphilus gyrociliatus TaxID=2664684 RepID=A0A7I8VYF9_9ANNE|nr:DgyrCDS9114 [Dimorphilus gyrociliatus]